MRYTMIIHYVTMSNRAKLINVKKKKNNYNMLLMENRELNIYRFFIKPHKVFGNICSTKLHFSTVRTVRNIYNFYTGSHKRITINY